MWLRKQERLEARLRASDAALQTQQQAHDAEIERLVLAHRAALATAIGSAQREAGVVLAAMATDLRASEREHVAVSAYLCRLREAVADEKQRADAAEHRAREAEGIAEVARGAAESAAAAVASAETAISSAEAEREAAVANAEVERERAEHAEQGRVSADAAREQAEAAAAAAVEEARMAEEEARMAEEEARMAEEARGQATADMEAAVSERGVAMAALAAMAGAQEAEAAGEAAAVCRAPVESFLLRLELQCVEAERDQERARWEAAKEDGACERSEARVAMGAVEAECLRSALADADMAHAAVVRQSRPVLRWRLAGLAALISVAAGARQRALRATGAADAMAAERDAMAAERDAMAAERDAAADLASQQSASHDELASSLEQERRARAAAQVAADDAASSRALLLAQLHALQKTSTAMSVATRLASAGLALAETTAATPTRDAAAAAVRWAKAASIKHDGEPSPSPRHGTAPPRINQPKAKARSWRAGLLCCSAAAVRRDAVVPWDVDDEQCNGSHE